MMNEELEFVKKGNKTLLLPEGGVPEGGGGRRNMPRKRLLFSIIIINRSNHTFPTTPPVGHPSFRKEGS